MRTHAVLGLIAAAALCACSSSGNANPVVTADAGVDATAPVVDSSAPPVDSSVPPDDTGAPDTSAPPVDAPVDSPADTGPTCAWNGTVESPACSACLRTNCCAVTGACENDTACVALDTCVNDCLTDNGGDAGSVSNCANACDNAQPQNVRDEYHAFSDCIANDCGGASGAGPCL